MVSKASEDLPEPERPVSTVSVSRGISTSTFFRLCSRAPRMTMFFSILRIFSGSDGRNSPESSRAHGSGTGQDRQIFGCYSTDIGRNCEKASRGGHETAVRMIVGSRFGHCWGLTRFLREHNRNELRMSNALSGSEA